MISLLTCFYTVQCFIPNQRLGDYKYESLYYNHFRFTILNFTD